MKDVPEELYREILKVTPIPGSLVYVVVQDEVLLLRRNVNPQFGYWSPPAGSMDMGETPEETALRELKEESGIELLEETLSFTGYNTYFHPNRQDVTFEFLADLDSKPKVELNLESSNFGWFNKYSLPTPMDKIVKKSLWEVL